MKNETNDQKLAQSAANTICVECFALKPPIDSHPIAVKLAAIILAVIEKAHQSGWHEGRQYQVEHGTPAQPQHSDPILIGKHIDIEFPCAGAASGTVAVATSEAKEQP